MGLNEDLVDCILEIKGSYKIGKYMPGTNIPIVDEKIIKLKQPDYLILFSWHISKSLIKNFRKLGFKGKFILPSTSFKNCKIILNKISIIIASNKIY